MYPPTYTISKNFATKKVFGLLARVMLVRCVALILSIFILIFFMATHPTTPHFNYCYFSLGNDAIPTNSMASPPPRIAKASKPTAKSNPDVFSIKLNYFPIKANHRYLLIAAKRKQSGRAEKNQL